MLISIVIPTYQKQKRLELVLLSLNQQDCGFENFEVIVVNDGSNDTTEQFVREHQNFFNYKLIYIYQDNRGRAAARNTGIKEAHGEFLLFLDDDRLMEEKYISTFINSIKNKTGKELVILGKRMELFLSRFDENFENIKMALINSQMEIYYKKAREEYYWRKIKQALEMPSISWIFFSTGNVLMSANLFKKVGLFNEGFQGWGFEDTELGYRLWLNNIKFIHNENATNYHIQHARNTLEMKKDILRNIDFFSKVHPECPMILYKKFFIDGDISLEAFNQAVLSGNLNYDIKMSNSQNYYNPIRF